MYGVVDPTLAPTIIFLTIDRRINNYTYDLQGWRGIIVEYINLCYADHDPENRGQASGSAGK